MTAEMRYHPMRAVGPIHPSNSDSFLLNKTMSSSGLEKFEYRLDTACPHFSMSSVSLWSGCGILASTVQTW